MLSKCIQFYVIKSNGRIKYVTISGYRTRKSDGKKDCRLMLRACYDYKQ